MNRDFQVTINGEQFNVIVDEYSPGKRNNWGHPDSRLPDDPEEVEFRLYDVEGNRADWAEDTINYETLEEVVLEKIHELQE